ncbi:hypothetical protein AS189_08315 [Arthrobacter alpinus]|uniref:Uncharacterized protein n=1 Tax=Arthrobacter alpinus TaxID=656366 RepID=A0A0S2LYB6_9MICC|nr:hypothetical protein [Arthrobacter alpinus]ALO66493.1 hypothetical protein AS189_08315 [Arthrobacter alpinus]
MRLIVIGAVGGLAWAGGLRAYMSELAGVESTYTWMGTLGALVAPAVVVGSLLGWAEVLRRDGGRRHWRKLALAPLLLPVGALAMPGAVQTLVTTGMGGGAIAVTAIGLAGAYAMSGRGHVWLRVLCSGMALSIVPLWSLSSWSIGGGDLAVTTPRGAMVALHFFALLAVLALAANIPLRPAVNALPEASNIRQEAVDNRPHAPAATPVGTVGATVYDHTTGRRVDPERRQRA